MNVKTWIPLAVAIVLGLVAAKVARDTLVRSRGNGEARAKTINVVVAKVPVSPGEALTADMLTLGPISAEVPPPGGHTDLHTVVGRVAGAPLFVGQPVLDTLLAAKGASAGLQALVPRGMRAITLEVNETSGVGGMIAPGCHVDVVSTLSAANRDETVACTIVQDVLVQAVGQRLSAARGVDDKDEAPVRSVTLIATPRDAEAIELATSSGRTRLVLRGPNDRGVSDSTGITFVELRGDDDSLGMPLPPPPLPAVATTQPVQPVATLPVATTQPAAEKAPDPFAGEDRRPRRTVTLIRGGTRSEVVFDLPAKTPPPPAKEGPAVTSTDDGGGSDD